MISKLKENLLNYLADSYFDAEWKKVDGKGNFNKDNKYPLSNFSLGNFRQVEKNFLLVQCKAVSGNRNDGMAGLGNIDYGTTITLNVYIERDVKPSDCAVISDLYISKLYDILQLWIYEQELITPSNPAINIDKYYQSNDGNFNSIDKLIIDGSITFTYKSNKLTLERLSND